MHSAAREWTEEQLGLIRECEGGLFGGSSQALDKYAGLFHRKRIQVKRSGDPDADFNLAVVNRKDLEKQFGIRRGIYYGYGVIP